MRRTADGQPVFGVGVPFCPVHEWDRSQCWDGCLPERMEYRAASTALRVYWSRLKHGRVKRYRGRCRFCGALFIGTKPNKRYCNQQHASLHWHRRRRVA